jgi:uncharacterized protein YdhG (YjbR/CyaY superfamily)
MKEENKVDTYIAAAPTGTQVRLREMRAIVRRAAPEATETMSYGIPTLRLEGNLVRFGGFKGHVSLFPGPSGIVRFRKELENYPVSKGSIHFPLDQKLPAALIKRIVAFLVEENLAKRKAKKGSRPVKGFNLANEKRAESLKVIASMVSKIRKAQSHLRPGSAQWSLARNRLAALRIATKLIRESMNERSSGGGVR